MIIMKAVQYGTSRVVMSFLKGDQSATSDFYKIIAISPEDTDLTLRTAGPNLICVVLGKVLNNPFE